MFIHPYIHVRIGGVYIDSKRLILQLIVFQSDLCTGRAARGPGRAGPGWAGPG